MGISVRPRLRWQWRKLAVATARSGVVKFPSPAELPVAQGLLLSFFSSACSCRLVPVKTLFCFRLAFVISCWFLIVNFD